MYNKLLTPLMVKVLVLVNGWCREKWAWNQPLLVILGLEVDVVVVGLEGRAAATGR
jgi:hypothetical protein